MSEAYASLSGTTLADGRPRTDAPDAAEGIDRGGLHYEASATFAFRVVGEGLLLQDLERDMHFTLNDSASQIWLRLCSGQSTDEVASAIGAETDADPDSVAHDVQETAERLSGMGLLRRAAS